MNLPPRPLSPFRVFACVVSLLFFTSTYLDAQNTVNLTITNVLISTSSSSITVPSGFAGFALNYDAVGQISGYTNSSSTNTPQNIAFIQYFNDLAPLIGPPGLRSGGAVADRSYWWSNSSDASLYNYYSNPGSFTIVSNAVLGAITQVVGTMQTNYPGVPMPFIMTLNYAGYNNQTSAPSLPPNLTPSIHFLAAITNAIAAAGLTNPMFEMGNESDNYGGGYRDSNWSAASDLTNWVAYAAALRGGVPGGTNLQLVAPAYSFGPLTPGAFINQTPSPATIATTVGLSQVTLHHYPHDGSYAALNNFTNNGTNASTNLAISLMLTASQCATNIAISPGNKEANPMNSGAESGPLYAPQVASVPTNIPVRIGEANSFGGGFLGADNAFAAALWGADTLASYARAGLAGVNFNSGLGGGYQPLQPVYDTNGNVIGLQAQPLYYGMYFFAQAAQNGGKIINATNILSDQFFSPGTQPVTNALFTNAITNPVPVSTYYFLDKLGNLRVLVINRSNPYATNSGNLAFNFWPTNSTNYSSNGTILSMMAVPSGTTNYATLSNSLGDTNAADITIGGQSFNPTNGQIATNAFVTTTITRNRSGIYSFNVPYASAAILTLKGASASITLGNTNQTYNGLGEGASTAVLPSDAGTVICSYSSGDYPSSTNPPTNVGTYVVSASLSNTFYSATTNGILTIAQATPTISFSTNLYPYTGNAVPAIATTTPANLPINFTYSSSNYPSTTNPPTNSGSYSVSATITATGNYSEATGSGTMTIVASPSIVSSLNPYALQGQSFIYQIVALNGASIFSASNLPTGLTLNTNTGLITGTLSTIGSDTFTVSAANSTGTNTATIVIAVTNSVYSFTNAGQTNWLCPTNVNSVQVECWGAGGAGGSASKNGASGFGGGGAGGAYARKTSYAVTPGATYTINVGSGGLPLATNAFTNGQVASPGGDSWFNSNNSVSSIILAKGGVGGTCIIGSTGNQYGAGGTGTTNNSIGDVLFAGGSGAQSSAVTFAGGGGGSAGPATNGNSAVANSGTGATAVAGGGNGGNPNPASGSSGAGQAPTQPPGGGGGGTRVGGATLYVGGSGASGQVVLTITNLAASVNLSSLTQTYNGLAKPIKTSTAPSNIPLLVTYSNSGYSSSTNAPTNSGSYIVTASTTNSSSIGSATGTLVIDSANPVITMFGSTNNPYNGYPWSLSTTVSPGGIPVIITYNGATSAPIAVGTYSVIASNSVDSVNSNWVASSTNATLTIYDPMSAWRLAYYGTTNNSGAAASSAQCGNGFNNNAAYTFGINPTSPAIAPLLALSNGGGNTLTLSFTALSAGSGAGYASLTRYYNLEETTNLNDSNSWTPVTGYSNIIGSNQAVSFSTNTSGGTKFFYMLKAWLQ